MLRRTKQACNEENGGGGGVVILNRIFRVGLVKKLTFKQTTSGMQVNHVAIQRKIISGRRNNHAKALRPYRA